MNITESNDVSVLIRALHGDTDIEPDRVADAAMALKARIDSALHASPDVDEAVVLASVVTLQVQIGGGLAEPDTIDDKIAEDIAAGRVTRVGSEEGFAEQAAAAKAKAAAKALVDA